MKNEATKLVPKFGRALVSRAEEILKTHENPPTEITFDSVDSLVRDTLELDQAMDELKEATVSVNKIIAQLEAKAGGYLRTLKRHEYKSPYGDVKIQGNWRVSLPQTDEDKSLFFDYLKNRGVFERYATVNSNSLNAFFKAEWEIAKKKDALAEVTFSLPGIPAPVFNELTKIKSPKGGDLNDNG